MTSALRVLSVGHVTHDVYPDGIVAGGCAYYGARVYQALGAQSELVTAVGVDFQRQVDVADLLAHCHHEGETTCFRNVYPPGGIRVQRIDAQGPMVVPPANLANYDVLHLAPVMCEVDLGMWADQTQARVRAISVQGWVKAAGAPFSNVYPDLGDPGPASARSVVQRPWTPDEAHLRTLDVASLGAEDLVGQGDLLERLVGNIPIVACTNGLEGADIYVDGRVTRIGTYSTTEVDPTGAGDTFAAGFVYALASGRDPVRAACVGAAAASIVVEGVGGQPISRIGAEAEVRARQIRTV